MEEYGVTIGDKNTLRDWGLVWTDFALSMPEAKIYRVAVPGRDGSLDLSEALAGDVTFEDRELVNVFAMPQEKILQWHTLYDEIANYCHGREMKIILDSSPDYFFMGRCSVQSSETGGEDLPITISATVRPYKLELTSSVEPWLWDSFNFETGIIREYADLAVDGSLTLTVPGRTMRVIPVITCSAPMTVEYLGVVYHLTAGNNKITDLYLGAGDNVLLFRGNGTVSVDYRGGVL